jgi:tetratricopeptide (TPR) repeat protein
MWNNCGPATLSMALSFFGYRNHQEVAARYLKPNGEDKNVSPYQMVNYVNQQVTDVSVNALTRIGGDMHLLKVLLANNFPVIIEKGYEVDDLDWMGHYLLLVGYDDALQVFYSYDSYLGHGNSQGLQESYSDVAYYWKHFNQTFIVLYEPWQQAQVLALLGSRAEPFTAAQQALDIAKTQVQFNSQDNWAWFNIGSAYTELGDYERAAQAFDQAFILGMPWRTLWYLHQPYQAYLAVGRYDDILAHTQATERTTVYVEETFYYRGAVLALAGNTQGANEAFSQALTYNRNFEPARLAREALQNGSFNKSLILNVGYGG